MLHELGVVHNDLKERNLLWDSESLVIIDFGAAGSFPSKNSTCTQGYRAPEHVRTPISDVYSCGVIFVNLVSRILTKLLFLIFCIIKLFGVRVRRSEQIYDIQQINYKEEIETWRARCVFYRFILNKCCNLS